MQVSNLIRLLASSMTCPNRDVHRSQIKLYTNVHITRFGSFPISHFLLTPCQCECTTELEEKNKARKRKQQYFNSNHHNLHISPCHRTSTQLVQPYINMRSGWVTRREVNKKVGTKKKLILKIDSWQISEAIYGNTF